MTRDEMYDTIAHLTVVMKFSAEDTAATIKEATGLSVDEDADDLLEGLSDIQIEAVYHCLAQLEYDLAERNSGAKNRIENDNGIVRVVYTNPDGSEVYRFLVRCAVCDREFESSLPPSVNQVCSVKCQHVKNSGEPDKGKSLGIGESKG